MEKKQSLPSRVYKEACLQVDNEVAQFRNSHNTMNGYYKQTVISPSDRVAESLIKSKNWSLYGKVAAAGGSNPVFGIDALVNERTPFAPTWGTVRSEITEEDLTLLKDLLKKETEVYNKKMDEADDLRVKFNHIASSTKLRITNARTMEELDKILVEFRETLKSL